MNYDPNMFDDEGMCRDCGVVPKERDRHVHWHGLEDRITGGLRSTLLGHTQALERAGIIKRPERRDLLKLGDQEFEFGEAVSQRTTEDR